MFRQVHAGFHRLSENPNFTIPLTLATDRTQRRQSAAPVKDPLAAVAVHLPGIDLGQPLRGSNNAVQHAGSVRYPSPVSDQPATIVIEVGPQGRLLRPAVRGQVRTVLRDRALRESDLERAIRRRGGG